ncbi:MAG: Efflux transporter periplasmic adaptor subunit [Pseudomonadota bacterium]|nr:Efflux transporter periplasmic adaptor subunit [Pseudomonadota bacterium]
MIFLMEKITKVIKLKELVCQLGYKIKKINNLIKNKKFSFRFKFKFKLIPAIVFTGIMIIILIAAGSIIRSCNSKHQNAIAPIPVMTVTITKPVVKELPIIIHANGNIQAWQETIIGAEVGGLDLSEVDVNIGDTVHKGQLLAKLNADQVNADIIQQIANVAEARANLEQALTEARQAAILQNAGAISSQDLLQYQTKAKTNQAKLDAANAALRLQQLKLSYTLIKAPDDGIISSRTATVGSVIQNGSELFRLVRENRLEWQAEVKPSDMGLIKTGQLVAVINDNGNITQGKVRQVAPALNQNTRNGTVYVDLPKGTNLKMGTYMSGSIQVGSQQFMVAPELAIVNREGYYYVMRLDSKRHARQTKVQLYGYRDKLALIESGINLTDTIIVDGVGFLNDGDFVGVAAVESQSI